MFNKKGMAGGKAWWWIIGVLGSAFTIALAIAISKILMKWWGVE